jgi:hypothetical protein
MLSMQGKRLNILYDQQSPAQCDSYRHRTYPSLVYCPAAVSTGSPYRTNKSASFFFHNDCKKEKYATE